MRCIAGFALGIFSALLWSATGRAETPPPAEIAASYSVYGAGLNTARLEVRLTFTPSSYQARLNYRTAGVFGAFFHAESSSLAQGLWHDDAVAPFHFAAVGRVQGSKRLTVIDYDAGQPLVRALAPANDVEREPVSPEMERNTVDTLSAMVLLVRRVQAAGRCDAHAATFDGRRLIDLTARTAGIQPVPRSGRSPYFGPALRCDFDGRQLGGFKYGEDPAELRRPKHGSAWLAQVVPGAPPVPIRLEFETRWFGLATVYLTQASATPSATAPLAGAAASKPGSTEAR
jgi:hypothetical protein